MDLFDDAPWPMELAVGQPVVRSPRPILGAALGFLLLFVVSMGLPWFTSAETPAWTPFSHWLDLGWSPGTERWGYLVLGLGLVAAAVTGVAVWSLNTRRLWSALSLTTALVVTVLEASANLAVDPGPNLHADYGAWIGSAAAVLGWAGIGLAIVVAPKRPAPGRAH